MTAIKGRRRAVPIPARRHGLEWCESRGTLPPNRQSKASTHPAPARLPRLQGGSRGGGARPSSLLDTRIVYCGDCLDQLRKLPQRFVDLIYIDAPFNSNRNYEVYWGQRSVPRAQSSGFLVRFEDRHAGTQAYIEPGAPR